MVVWAVVVDSFGCASGIAGYGRWHCWLWQVALLVVAGGIVGYLWHVAFLVVAGGSVSCDKWPFWL